MEQAKALKIGKYGCYFLCIIKAAIMATGEKFDILDIYSEAIKRGCMNENCYIKDPAGLMQLLTGERYTISHMTDKYKAQKGEIEILNYGLQEIGEYLNHFCLVLDNGEIYDPLGVSRVRSRGKIVSKRILKKISKRL